MVADLSDCKVDPQVISNLYRDFVMPLTKQVQVAYLLARLAHPTVSVAGAVGSFAWSAAQAMFTDQDDKHFAVVDSTEKVFSDICSNKAAYGVVLMEDSSSGMIKTTQSQLIARFAICYSQCPRRCPH